MFRATQKIKTWLIACLMAVVTALVAVSACLLPTSTVVNAAEELNQDASDATSVEGWKAQVNAAVEEIENDPLGFRKFPDHPHQFLLRNLCDLFIRGFRNLFLHWFYWLQIHPFGFTQMIDHHIHRDSSTP